uniref:Uncharacterized protein n=1 Tax=Arundo donax TaxID=35708 RepID=A0A0A8XUW4_ARUDO
MNCLINNESRDLAIPVGLIVILMSQTH